MTKFVDAYSKSTGRKQTIPERWLSIGHAPFNDFSLTPPQKRAATATPAEPDSKKEAK